MKKILWVINPLDFKESDCEFPHYMADLTEGEVSVAFIDTGIAEIAPVAADSLILPTRDYRLLDYPVIINEEKRAMTGSTHALIRGFFSARNKTIHFHENESLDFEDLIRESRFADLMLTSISLSGLLNENHSLSHRVKELLVRAQCPVLIAPENLQEIQKIYFTYNGSYSSVYAIRQFTMLFRNLSHIPVTVLTVLESVKEEELPDKKLLNEFLSRNYKTFGFKLLQGHPDKELLIELMYQRNAIVTFGAFGRNRVSRMLNPSHSEKVTEGINIPVFITHP